MTYNNKYNWEFTQEQLNYKKEDLHRLIHFLLICKDDRTNKEYRDIDFDLCFMNLQNRLKGFNELMGNPKELIVLLSLLESAYSCSKEIPFNYKNFRKLILDAHATLDKFGCEDNDNIK